MSILRFNFFFRLYWFKTMWRSDCFFSSSCFFLSELRERKKIIFFFVHFGLSATFLEQLWSCSASSSIVAAPDNSHLHSVYNTINCKSGLHYPPPPQTLRHRWDTAHTHSFFRCLSRLSHAHSGNRSLGSISMLNDVCAAFQLASTLIGLIVDEFLLNMYMRFAAGLDAVCLVSRAKLCVCNGRRSFFFACILMQSLRLHTYHHCLLLYAIVIIIVCYQVNTLIVFEWNCIFYTNRMVYRKDRTHQFQAKTKSGKLSLKLILFSEASSILQIAW